jgi:oligogalacturonide lyase
MTMFRSFGCMLAMFTVLLAASALAETRAAETPPLEWIDPVTGHRVVQLSRVPGSNYCLYFHQPAFSADGRTMVYYNLLKSAEHRLFTVDLQSHENRPLTDQDSTFEVVGRRSGEVFYVSKYELCATSLSTGQTRVITKLNPEWVNNGTGLAINSDETLLAGAASPGERAIRKSMPRSEWFTAIAKANLPAVIYSINIRSGEVRTIQECRDWPGHLQFSPTDPGLLMFCHEGPWDKVDRIWHIRTDGTGLRRVFTRTAPREIAGHEFWSADGNWVWFDHQNPKKVNYFLTGIELGTSRQLRYPLRPEQWSVHYNISPDGSLFAGDGYSYAGDAGKFIWLFRPDGNQLKAEKLCSLKNHQYKLEPDVRFSPDNKWVIFRSNMRGSAQVYAVEIAPKNRSN